MRRTSHVSVEEYCERTGACAGGVMKYVRLHGLLTEAQAISVGDAYSAKLLAACHGDGYGYGSGYGNGNGHGDGYGSGYGNGNGHGYGRG